MADHPHSNGGVEEADSVFTGGGGEEEESGGGNNVEWCGKGPVGMDDDDSGGVRAMLGVKAGRRWRQRCRWRRRC